MVVYVGICTERGICVEEENALPFIRSRGFDGDPKILFVKSLDLAKRSQPFELCNRVAGIGHKLPQKDLFFRIQPFFDDRENMLGFYRDSPFFQVFHVYASFR